MRDTDRPICRLYAEPNRSTLFFDLVQQSTSEHRLCNMICKRRNENMIFFVVLSNSFMTYEDYLKRA